MLTTVAALYIDPIGGPYPHIHGVESWGLPYRDARRYDGPYPVVAHPPCGAWSRLAHQYRKDDRALALRAVEQVRLWGGVLEHPAGSALWREFSLPDPRVGVDHEGDRFGGYSIEVEQVSWGHVARKPTWLYLVCVPRGVVTATMRTGGTPTHWCSGGRAHDRTGSGGFAPPGIKICSAEQRRRTPPAFAEWLVSLARASTGKGNPA